ncbi:DUF5999 family protein [Kitasatospora sp. NPDC094028]
MCSHKPECPTADDPDSQSAAAVSCHPDQGWSLLCNGVLLFEDTGVILPDGRSIGPTRLSGTVAA